MVDDAGEVLGELGGVVHRGRDEQHAPVRGHGAQQHAHVAQPVTRGLHLGDGDLALLRHVTHILVFGIARSGDTDTVPTTVGHRAGGPAMLWVLT